MTGTAGRILLFASDVGDINRMFMFATNDGIGMLDNSSQWFVDGIFKLCPQIYFLKYMTCSIMKFFPVLFHFCRLKLYEQFFTAVCNAIRNNNGNNPDVFLFDFEAASINSIQKVLPKTDISGCFFHLSSSLWKHSNVPDYKNFTSTTSNLVYSYVWLLF